ncbi:MAG: YqeG family HAD IIIA-type phosphatase [Capsulimonas sp.]|uniref:YqeG family HAD IIIA-type phosphatase n=1 Tax=Capsulimonas sp. TaxID=2494211 RepID=UPI0032633F94|nr:yqeG [Capsulimonas sp.]
MAKFMQLLTPTWVVESVKDVDPAALKARGITAIITDLDNTLVPWRHYDIAPGVIEWLAKLEVEGIKICIASNTLHMERLQQLADTMGIPFVDRVRKPHTGGFLRSMQAMGSTQENTAVFGDQIFTDVLAGNRLGLKTILIRPPLSREEFFSTQMVRYVENYVIRKLREQGQWPAARKIAEVLESMPDPSTPQGRTIVASIVSVPVLLLGGAALFAYTVWRRKRK